MFRILPVFVLLGLMLMVAVALGTGGLRPRRPADPRRYRPRGKRGGDGMTFDDAGAATGPTGSGSRAARAGAAGSEAATPAPETAAATDFVTGAALDPGQGIVRCNECRALYHPDSAALLDVHNGGCCASCGSQALQRLDDTELRRFRGSTAWPRRDRAVVAEVGPGDAYERLVGRMVTVSGTAGPALPTRRTGEFSLLFRDRVLGTECRLTFVGAAVRGLRGRAFVHGLIGSKVKVRALLLRHEVHGFQLLITDPAMVLESAG
jgi:hypothetical protein